MTDDVKTAMMEVVKEAMLAEVKGHQLYTHAATTTTDPAVRGIFESLAKDEEGHMSTAEVGGGSHAIIDDAFKKSLKTGTFEMAAIGIGCDLEKRAIAFYPEHAEKTDDPDLKKLFSWLTEWEKAHLAQLLDLEKFYKDAFWAEQGFMPM